MITLQRLLSELKAESLNEIIAGYGSTPPPVCGGSSNKSSKSHGSGKHRCKKQKKTRKHCG